MVLPLLLVVPCQLVKGEEYEVDVAILFFFFTTVLSTVRLAVLDWKVSLIF